MELIASYMEITVVTESGENVLPNKGLPPVAAPIFLNFYLDDLDRAFQCDFFPGARYGEEVLLPFLSQKEEKCTIQQITELMTELDLLYRIIEVETGGPAIDCAGGNSDF